MEAKYRTKKRGLQYYEGRKFDNNEQKIIQILR